MPDNLTPDELVRREVHYCVSSLVSTLAQANYCEDDSQALGEMKDQALSLAAQIDDWEEAATQVGWTFAPGCDPNTIDAKLGGEYPRTIYGNAGEDANTVAQRIDGLEPYQREVYEHWIVSDWLADKLEARGEKVDRDFAGMTVWARTTTGQAIALDSVIESICRDLPGEIEAALAPFHNEQYAREHGLEVRHDLHGFYVCTTEEGEHEDEGHNSVGFDGRTHWPDKADAWAAAADSARIAARESEG